MKIKKHQLKYNISKKFTKHLNRFGEFGFKIILFKRISKKKEDFLKFLILKKTKEFSSKKIKLWFFSNCYFNLTQLPLESGMGKGKGEVKDLFAFYKKGFILFEMKGISFFDSIKLLNFLNNQNIIKFKLVF